MVSFKRRRAGTYGRYRRSYRRRPTFRRSRFRRRTFRRRYRSRYHGSTTKKSRAIARLIKSGMSVGDALNAVGRGVKRGFEFVYDNAAPPVKKHMGDLIGHAANAVVGAAVQSGGQALLGSRARTNQRALMNVN
jgi:hypothetical protein